MIRLKVKEFVQENAEDLTMTRLGILAQVSQNFMVKIWHNPAAMNIYLYQLDKVAQALSDHLHREVTICDLIEARNPPHS